MMKRIFREADFKMQMRSGGRACRADQTKHITRLHMLTNDRDDLAHVCIDRKKLLVFVTKVMADDNGLTVWIVVIAGGLHKESPVCPDHGAGSCGVNRRSIRGGDVHAGVYGIAKEDSTVAIIGKRPVDLIRGDGAREIKMIVGRHGPRNRIQWRTPT